MTCTVTQGPILPRAPPLVSAVTVLKYLIFEQGTLCFHFALDSAHYVTGLGDDVVLGLCWGKPIPSMPSSPAA